MNSTAQKLMKVSWILANWTRFNLDGYPWGAADRAPYNTESLIRRQRERDIIEAMKRSGLISKNTYWKDVALNNLIQDARKMKRMVKIKNEISNEEL